MIETNSIHQALSPSPQATAPALVAAALLRPGRTEVSASFNLDVLGQHHLTRYKAILFARVPPRHFLSVLHSLLISETSLTMRRSNPSLTSSPDVKS